jgi:hypothetical protein
MSARRDREQGVWREQAYSTEYLRDKVNQVISAYESVGKTDQINHKDRIDWINSKIAQRGLHSTESLPK